MEEIRLEELQRFEVGTVKAVANYRLFDDFNDKLNFNEIKICFIWFDVVCGEQGPTT